MNELEIKTERLTQMLAESGHDAVILNAQHNFAWLTGGATNGVDLSRENGVASLLITRDCKRYLLANNIEMPRMLAEQVDAVEFEPIEFTWQDEKANGSLVLEKTKQLTGHTRIATDTAIFADTPAIEPAITRCRAVLTSEEIERFRRLGSDTAAAMDRTIGKVSRRETEIAIAERLRIELASDGIVSVVTLVGADDRIAQFRHPVPTDRRFNTTLLLVTCAKRHGLIASLSRMVSIGEPTDELKTKTEAAAGVHAALLDATLPGTTGADLYRTASEAYAAAGFGDEIGRHHQGGATGYRTRDWVAHPACGEVVATDQAFAWNPSITGTKVEETCIVTADGIEMITSSSNVPNDHFNHSGA